MFFEKPAAFGLAESVWLTFPVNVGLAVLAGTLSYFVLEKPFEALRRRLTQPMRADSAIEPSRDGGQHCVAGTEAPTLFA